ncbi:MAG TPA: hypothetical protein VLB29_19755 [Nocardioidaceae bacterium]|nr:hypothetical protein [Nocardioidaceae bacterium]
MRMSTDRFGDLTRPFARGIYDLLRALDDPPLQLNKHQSARVREAVSVSIRKVCDVLVPDARHPEVSVAAAERAAELGVNLWVQTWQTQTKFDPGRSVFHYEHMRPIAAIRNALGSATSPDEVIETIRRDLRLAWITKEENLRLTSLGYNSVRPDPDAAYAEAGIVLMPREADE